MREIVLVAHNIRSSQNVGSLLRTAEGLGAKVYLSGYTPHPKVAGDERMPHEIARTTKQIAKTALGAEQSADWTWHKSLIAVVSKLKQQGYTVLALEQAKGSIAINRYEPPAKIAVIVGNEVNGLEPAEIKLANKVVEIPMFGKKESFNVANSAAMALFHLRFAK